LGEAEVEGYLEGFTAYRDMLRSGRSIFPAPPVDLRVQGEELEALKGGLWNGMGLMSLFAIPNLMRMPELNEEVGDHVRDRVRQMVRDPEVAERPEDLVVYGGIGKAARNWESFDRILESLKQLEADETLLIQSSDVECDIGRMRRV
jgi:hypothetical protein